MNKKIKFDKIFDIILLFYLVSLTSFHIGTGIDPILKKLALGSLILVFLLKYKKIMIKKLTLYIMGFWTFYLLSVLWCSNTNDVLFYLNICIYTIIFSVILSNYITTKEDIIKIFKLTVYSLLISCAILFVRTPFSDWGTVRIGAAIGLHPNSLGARLAYGFIISIYLLYNRQNNKLIENIIYIVSSTQPVRMTRPAVKL